ncbi:MAG: hypothetical protein JWQ01_4839 [Massilia sp.]|nr:hypothetical protein [Massilia sp.]
MSAPLVKFKFKAVGYSWRAEIERVEYTGETAKMVTTREKASCGGGFYERKRLKISDNDCYFDTWAEAHELLLSRAERKFDSARTSMESAKDALDIVKGMKPPAA